MKYNEKVERCAPKLGRKNLVNGLSCSPFVYMEDSDDGMWVHYGKYCENMAHQKYKRCLAMARWCETRHFIIRYIQADKILNDENYIGTDDYLRREYMIKHYCRWANKWLELAEKFKEVDDG